MSESDSEQIRNLLAFVMQFTDGHGTYEQYFERWTEDCRWEAPAAGVWEGHEGQRGRHEHFRKMGIQGPGIETFHLSTTAYVDVHGDTATALSTWVFIDRNGGSPCIRDVGTFSDALVKVDGAWKIRSRQVAQGSGDWLGDAKIGS
jgi:SnoaL-like protein